MHFLKYLKSNSLVKTAGCFLMMTCHYSFSQTVWQGQHHASRIILTGELQKMQTDSLLLSIPELEMKNIKVDARGKGDSLSFSSKSYGITFKGKFDAAKKSITGIFNNYSIANAPVVLKKHQQVQPLYFAQHPKGPYPYDVIDMTFLGESTKLTYGGTLTIPKKKKNYPLAVLITGTGQQDRDYVYSGKKFFAVLADYLARHGIASFRADDRGTGMTSGDFQNATTEDFANDAEAQIAYLKKDKNVDTSFIGLIGHSEGGMTASIASSRNESVKFMVSLSGVGVSGLEMLSLQNEAVLRKYFKKQAADKQMELYRILFQTVYQTPDNEPAEPVLEEKLTSWLQTQDPALIKEIGMSDGREKNFLYRYSKEAERRWYRYMIHYDPKDYLSKITIPVLAVNGEKDISVPAAENLKSFKDKLKSSDVTTRIYPGLNHMYQHCTLCTNEEMKNLDEVFAPEVLEDVSRWILEHYR